MKEQDFMRILGNTIRAYRVSAGMKQSDLAQAIGRSIASISKYERGDCAIDSYTLTNIADALNVSTSQLLPTDPVGRVFADDQRWSILTKHDTFYLHNIGYISQRLCCSLIKIDWSVNEAVMYVDMGLPVSKVEIHAESILHGRIYSTSASTIIWVNNPVAPIDFYHIVINSADWYAGRQICHIHYSTSNWRSVASKGVITTSPKCPKNIDELLTFSKEELREIKRKNQVLF